MRGLPCELWAMLYYAKEGISVFNDKDVISVLIVSASQKMTDTIMELLPSRRFSPIMTVSTAGEAKRCLVDKPYDIVLIMTPLKDDFGIQLSLEVVESSQSGVMIFVKSELYEQATYKVEDHGVLTLALPCPRQAIYQAIKLLVATLSMF